MTIEVNLQKGLIELDANHQKILDSLCCKECGKKLNHIDLMSSLLNHGVFFLAGDGEYYFGTNCSVESCQKTFVSEIDMYDLAYSAELISYYANQGVWTPRRCLPFPKSPRYFSSVNYSPDQFAALKGYEIHTWQSDPYREDVLGIQEFALECYTQDHPYLFSEYCCSYILNCTKPLGQITAWWFHMNDIYELIQLENTKQLRIFPRYIIDTPLFEAIDKFCWDYFLKEEYGMDPYQKRKTTSNINKSPGINLYKTADFWKILSFGFMKPTIPHDFSFSAKDGKFIELEHYKRCANKLYETQAPNLFDITHDEMTSKLIPIINKGFMQKLMIKISENFIQDYIQLFKKSEFSYLAVWELKEKYLYQVYSARDRYEDVRKKPKLRPDQRHRLACIDVAKKIWKKQPSITIAAMIDRQEIFDACEGKIYGEKIVRNWVRGECPNPRRGRPPKKKK